MTEVWPDGHETHGFKQHIDDMIYMFRYAPDTKITEHPVKFGGVWLSQNRYSLSNSSPFQRAIVAIWSLNAFPVGAMTAVHSPCEGLLP